MEGYVKSGLPGALEPGKLGLNCKANKCRDTGTGDLGVLATHETSRSFVLGNPGQPAWVNAALSTSTNNKVAKKSYSISSALCQKLVNKLLNMLH